jgi:glycosyltransferase involved in cell wall biosynthesis
MPPWLCETHLGELEINAEHPSRKAIEHYAAEFFAENGCETSRVFLPGQWTAFWRTARKNPLRRLAGRFNVGCLSPQGRLSRFLESTLDNNQRYFTILQRSTDIAALFPSNVLVFGAGGEGHIPIPLIKEVPESLRQLRTGQVRDIKANFIGQWDGFNDPDDIRKQMVSVVKDLPGYIVGKQPYAEYTRTLARSDFTLCPSGFGRTSFRMYEALAMGSIPVYIYKDTPWLPYQTQIDWNRCALLVERRDIGTVPSLIASISDDDIRQRRDYIDSLYDRFFSFHGICQNIKYYLEHEHENH